MIDTTGKIEMTNGRKTRWIASQDVASYREQGYEQVKSQATTIVMKPPKSAVQATVDEPKPIQEE
jgi:hypothetical protein